MRISDTEVKKILAKSVIQDIESLMEGIDDPQYEIDPQMVKRLTREVIEMPDRDDFVAEIKARIEKGEYKPTGEEIADAMIRRSIADRVR
ncbi:MAG: flagellar biosynthesis anti-sigma factor FlgM [Fimbriimonadaceae bacterium]|uniref:Anti-sigma-28 factor, FlgM family n=1 Tax=Candidatus Nitrosymbiomonas proteolyticus TaxID=2608984 RepID=A0A809S3C0_9BACT|nr:flagellar biosynthesis anti-sigma factor FlgM [Fimbriimonadaceae bacterium]NUM38271.1 flagellar biosynthesis anti-sigma factor FlgM [Armatimonadota bacterium]BBO23016.1 anti-sigma-28 factor, FlgM family [Candidatus Nitrosymbiomonas proteolyticus]